MQLRELVEEYAKRYQNSESSTHTIIEEAACDTRLASVCLFEDAIAQEIENAANFSLLVLHERADETVISLAIGELNSSQDCRREIAARVLKELRERPQRERITEAVAAHLTEGLGEELTASFLRTIAAQQTKRGAAIMLQYKDDQRSAVRHMLSHNLIHFLDDDEQLESDLMDVLVNLAKDKDPGVRWSIYYDVADWPKTFGKRWPDFKAAISPSESNDDVLASQKKALRTYEGPVDER